MKKMMVKNLIIVALSLTVVFLSIGFCILSMKLNDYREEDAYYDVSIDRVVLGNVINSDNIKPSSSYNIINGDKTVKFIFELYNPKDSISYSVFIKNKGNVPAKIDRVIESLSYNKSDLYPIQITYDEIDGEILNPNDEVKLVISVNYGNGLSKYNKIPYEISILTSSLKQ